MYGTGGKIVYGFGTWYLSWEKWRAVWRACCWSTVSDTGAYLCCPKVPAGINVMSSYMTSYGTTPVTRSRRQGKHTDEELSSDSCSLMCLLWASFIEVDCLELAAVSCLTSFLRFNVPQFIGLRMGPSGVVRDHFVKSGFHKRWQVSSGSGWGLVEGGRDHFLKSGFHKNGKFPLPNDNSASYTDWSLPTHGSHVRIQGFSGDAYCFQLQGRIVYVNW